MGFGCNVPAVISTGACSSCSRGTAISAIAFGAACSYQLPATLAVLAAASKTFGLNLFLLPFLFLSYLLLTTLNRKVIRRHLLIAIAGLVLTWSIALPFGTLLYQLGNPPISSKFRKEELGLVGNIGFRFCEAFFTFWFFVIVANIGSFLMPKVLSSRCVFP